MAGPGFLFDERNERLLGARKADVLAMEALGDWFPVARRAAVRKFTLLGATATLEAGGEATPGAVIAVTAEERWTVDGPRWWPYRVRDARRTEVLLWLRRFGPDGPRGRREAP